MLRAFAGGAFFGEGLGDAPYRVLALHGWRRTHEDFRASLTGLPALAVDLPGFGASPPPPEPWSTAAYADAVAALLAGDGPVPQPAVVVGHSFGGRVAVHLAAGHPDAVAALVLTGVPLVRPEGGSGSRPPWRFRVGRFLHRRRLLPDERMERLRQRYGSEDYRAATGVMRDVLVKAVNETYEQQLAGVRCPVELVWGETDTAAPFDAVRRAASRLVQPTLTVVPGTGHLLPTDAPDALRAAVERALAVAGSGR